MKLLGKLRNRLKNKKGFTLVELIVVIVIIAILAALIVPSVMKYIDKAKDQQVLADARSLYIASQTVATEAYAQSDTSVQGVDFGVSQTDVVDPLPEKATRAQKIASLGKVKATKFTATITINDKFEVTAFSYVGDGKKVTYDTTKNVWSSITKVAD